MDRSEPATGVGLELDRTDVGSNFVSNYPPYSFWREALAGEAESALDRPADAATPLGVYLHVPFCRKRCKFCYFKVFTDKNARDVERYLDALASEATARAGRAAIAGRAPRFVYVGGGTPSFVSARHLRQLFGRLKRIFPWDRVEEVTFECEPGTLTLPKLVAIREVGVTRLSLGVENFDDRILSENGRAHTTREIDRVTPWIAEVGFDQLNIDLIAGMAGETWESWRQSVARAAAMAPDSVTIYQMELPYNTVYSQRLLEGGSVPIADWATKRAWHEHAFAELERAGYVASSAYTMVRGDRAVRFVYRDAVWSGCDLLGLGLSSFSHVNGVHFQNVAAWGDYLARVEEGRPAVSRAFVPSRDERQVREMILQLKRGWLEPDYFAAKYGVAILERYAEVFGTLAERGLARLAPGRIELTREGLLRADQLLPLFYAPEYQNARYT